ncbi:MAG TPA: ATP-binding protein [Prolixibacteraceae bacterium]|nr:ATP-binding protein [Prolixibacteraceae bacterium]
MEIAIISGKGGTGKSSITAAFAALGRQVVLADCDVDAANLYLLFNPAHEEEQIYISGQKAVIDYAVCTSCGICIDYCRFDAISEKEGRVEILETSCDGCHLCARVCPEKAIAMVNSDQSRMVAGSFRFGKMVYGRLAPGEENSGKLVNMVREKASAMAAALTSPGKPPLILLDGPPGIGCPVISTITGVDHVVIVTEPSLSGLHDLQRAVAVALKMERKVSVIINKWDLHPALSNEIAAWCRHAGVAMAGQIPFSEVVVEAMVHQKSIPEWAPDHEVSTQLRSIFKWLISSCLLEMK